MTTAIITMLAFVLGYQLGRAIANHHRLDEKVARGQKNGAEKRIRITDEIERVEDGEEWWLESAKREEK